MRLRPLFFAVLIGFSGCGKPETPSPATQLRIIDASQLRPAFSSATPEARALVDRSMMFIQDSEDAKAIADLDRLAKLPGITETQRQVATNVAEQLKKRLAAAQTR